MLTDFEIRLKLDDTASDPFADDILDALYEAGCDDATFSMSGGVLTAAFMREGPWEGAVASALEDIWKVLPDAEVIGIEFPDNKEVEAR